MQPLGKNMKQSCSSLFFMLLTLQLFYGRSSSLGMELQLNQTYINCSYPTGVLSLTAGRFRGPEDSVSLGHVAQCLAQSAVLFHGL
jgi:hypothetical protein